MKATKMSTIPRLRSGWQAVRLSSPSKSCRAICVLALGLIVCSAQFARAAPMGTAFTYQGHLYDTNHVADGLYDFAFKLYDANVGGSKVGTDVNVADVDVIDAYFTVELDFGSDVFDGNAVWLEIGVRPGEMNDPNAYTTLTPRQKVTAAPYAFYAKNSSGLALPYAGSATGSGGPVLSITNTGTGSAIKGTGQNGYGVRGESSVVGSSGVFGINKSAGGYGVFGWSDSGTGVKGFTSGTGVAGQFQIAYTGNSNAALEGRTNGAGAGVYGWATADKGTNYGVRGRTESADGYAGYFEGRVYASDRVGIGTISPATSLEVNGQVKITGGSPAVGKVLTSDADGLASWQTPSAIADSDWQVSGGDMYSIPSGNIGIGTTTPRGKLDVEGDGSNIYLDTWSAQVYIGDIDGDGDETLFTLDDNAGKFTFENGNVGIGITNPDEKLTVDGTIKSTTSAADGRAVYAEASNSGDVTNYGGYFTALGSEGRGVYGKASAGGDVTNFGGYFESPSRYGAGVYGEASHSYGGKGVWGKATGDAGIGVRGETSGAINAGVFGTCSNSTSGKGVLGMASGSSGRGVYGYASATSGTNYGVYGKTASSSGYAGFFEGNVKIDGTEKGLIFPDGSKQTTAAATEEIYFSVKRDASYDWPTNGTEIGIDFSSNSTVWSNVGGGFNTAMSKFVAPVSGIYTFHGAIDFKGLTVGDLIHAQIYVGSKYYQGAWRRASGTSEIVLASISTHLDAGESAGLRGYISAASPPAQVYGNTSPGYAFTYFAGARVF